MSLRDGGAIPDRYGNIDRASCTVKITIAKNSVFITEQQLMVDIQSRLKGKEVKTVFQTGRSYIWFFEFVMGSDCRTFIEEGTIYGEGYCAAVQRCNRPEVYPQDSLAAIPNAVEVSCSFGLLTMAES